MESSKTQQPSSVFRRLERLARDSRTDRLVDGYRLAILSSVLLVAALSSTLDGMLRLLIIAPLLASGVAVFAGRLRSGSVAVLLPEIAAATALVMASGGPRSPFIAYFTVPLVDAALLLRLTGRLSAIGAAIAGLLIATVGAGGIGSFGMAIVSEGMLVVALPVLLTLLSGKDESGDVELARLAELTGDDWQLVESLDAGATYSEIAEKLDVSTETVKVRIGRLYRRLGARNRMEALTFAKRLRPPR